MIFIKDAKKLVNSQTKKNVKLLIITLLTDETYYKGISLDKLTNREKVFLIDALRNKYKLNELLPVLHLSKMIIPELSEPPVRTLGATIPENESRLFR